MYDISDVGIKCTGCAACKAVCPRGCITMMPDSEGFLYPRIDREHCIACGKCVSVCSALSDISREKPIQAFAATSKDVTNTRQSSSGGVFFHAARYMIEHMHGYVCGAVLDEQLNLRHRVINRVSEIGKMQGSKYIQSSLDSCHDAITKALNKGHNVLFCGTPCQVMGMAKLVGNREQFYTMDLVCHGVPSNLAFQEYMQKAYRLSEFVNFTFRQKGKHMKSSFSYCYGDKRMIVIPAFKDPFYQAFLDGYNYRESCYTCHFACANRIGDITIGDCASWRMYDLPIDKVISMVAINTVKGKRLWNLIKDESLYTDADYAQETKLNGQLNAPFIRTEKRNTFYMDLRNMEIHQLKSKYCPRKNFKDKARYFVLIHTSVQMRDDIKHIFKRKK